jgi:hypothetical protein
VTAKFGSLIRTWKEAVVAVSIKGEEFVGHLSILQILRKVSALFS